MRKFFKLLHKWLSIPVGLIIFIICITGSILAFEKEIMECVYPERYFVKENVASPIPLKDLIPMAQSQLKAQKIIGVSISPEANRTYTLNLDGRRNTAFVNPYTGEVTGVYIYSESFFYSMMSLHRWLMDGSHTWGKYTVGITTLIFVIILISGIFIWIPKDKKKWKSRFTLNLRKGWRRFWYDAHIVLGFYACLLLLVCALTGLMWSFDWYRNGVNSLLGVETPKPKKEGDGERRRDGDNKGRKEELNILHWDDVFAQIREKEPRYQTISIQDASASVLPGDAPHRRAMDSYKFDANNGNIKKVILYEDTPESRRVMLWAYNLHVGAYGGLTTRILTCLACLIGATLPLTGYYLWFVKGKRKKKKVVEG